MNKYTAIIIEPRKHNALSFVLRNFIENLSDEWSFIIFHGKDNANYVDTIIEEELFEYKHKIRCINLNIYNLYRKEYDTLLKTIDFYNHIRTETFLLFQVDTLILKENKHIINDFLKYDYVGAPWRDGVVGNGGLSLRKKSKMLEIINHYGYMDKNEDEYFTRQTAIPLYRPSAEKAKEFSVELLFHEAPFGVHNCYRPDYLDKWEWNSLVTKYPELQTLYKLNTIPSNYKEGRFTIIYKTYEKDIEFLKYSLLSLQKYLDFSNIEMIIYTHHIANTFLTIMLEDINMYKYCNIKIIPVTYDYHGYVKQMVVKADCYKDCVTEYIVILDSDVLLTRKLNFNEYIKENGKIEWYYLKIEDEPNNEAFYVWKKACEDSNKTVKNIHYMSNGFPFVFTRRSLEDAANKFIKTHYCDYDTYCKKRCISSDIRVDDSILKTFNNKLSLVFTEFEYIGYYCHHYSSDYTFITTPYCRMSSQLKKINPNIPFVQSWTHHGLTPETVGVINQVLGENTITCIKQIKYKSFHWQKYVTQYIDLASITNKNDAWHHWTNFGRQEKREMPTQSFGQNFTIVYKTYEKDIEWLKYSLLSLQKYLDFSNIFELIIYTRDIGYVELCNMLDEINMKIFVDYKIIPISYDYHGYIKQRVVKLNCYKDCETEYIVILDSDVLLYKQLNFNEYIKENNKIKWYYLKKDDHQNNRVFDIWKNGSEDTTCTVKKTHYMSNGFPFIFTKRSLEDGANKFKEIHYCDYDSYCYNRCSAENINIDDNIVSNFFTLVKVFAEMEYIGHYCHHYSSDYIFIPSSYCRLESQMRKINPELCFLQNWSHGGIDENSKQIINNVLNNEIVFKNIETKNKTVILVWTQKLCNRVSNNYDYFWGLGDIVRGAIYMFQLSKKYGFRLLVDIQLHPISKFLKKQTHEYNNYVLQNKDNIHYYGKYLETKILTTHDEVICVFTNNKFKQEITEECKAFIKSILTPNDEFQNYMNQILLKTPPPLNYTIIHFRLGDSLLIRGEYEENNFMKQLTVFKNHKDPTDVLISDCMPFKEFISSNCSDIFLYDMYVSHIGYESHENSIKDTLFEFFLVTHSKKIKTFCVYDHISGFVLIAHQIYDIPLARIY